MKAFQVIMSLLILAALLVSGYVAWLTYKDMQKKAAQLPIEAFEAHLKKNNPNPIKIQGWFSDQDQTNILLEVVTPDTTQTLQDMAAFKKLQTAKGEEWYQMGQNEWVKVDTTPMAKQPAAKK